MERDLDFNSHGAKVLEKIKKGKPMFGKDDDFHRGWRRYLKQPSLHYVRRLNQEQRHKYSSIIRKVIIPNLNS